MIFGRQNENPKEAALKRARLEEEKEKFLPYAKQIYSLFKELENLCGADSFVEEIIFNGWQYDGSELEEATPSFAEKEAENKND